LAIYWVNFKNYLPLSSKFEANFNCVLTGITYLYYQYVLFNIK